MSDEHPIAPPGAAAQSGHGPRPSKRRPSLGQRTATAELATLPNLGPKSAEALVSAGILSPEQLRRLGAVRAYAKVKQRQPSVTLNLLWALEGALCSLPWQTVAKEHRTSLLLALEAHEMAATPKAGGRDPGHPTSG